MRGVRLIIQGRVQGVGFRYYVLHRARELGIKGYVKNLPNGNVLVEAVGNDENLPRFIDECRKGPPLARVTGISASDALNTDYQEFTIK
ncbi:MAG: acylphosphatase [Bacteroidales bacterium]